MDLRALQAHIAALYGDKDRARGAEGTFMYLVEEVGETATAMREGSREELAAELADVLAWTISLAEVRGIDLAAAVERKYASCGGCGSVPCACPTKP